MYSFKNCALFAAVVTVACTGTVIADRYIPTVSDADVDRNGIVKAMDLIQVATSMSKTCDEQEIECRSDVDKDGFTTITDLLHVIAFWGELSEHEPTPPEEPEEPEDPVEPEETPHERYGGPNPIVMDSVYFGFYSRNAQRVQLAIDLDQGWRTRTWNEENGVAVIPYAYHGGVDWNVDMEYTEYDLERFEEWLDENVPYDYEGPVVLDMEGEWWDMMTWANTQHQMDVILDFYIEGLHHAQSMRPNAKFGYWGLPRKDMTAESFTGPSVQRLLLECDAIFPDTYESNDGGNDAERMEYHITECIKMVNGEVPVHVQMFPRYKDPVLGGWRHYFSRSEFIRDQARPALEASWTDPSGTTHRAVSIAIWDCYNYEKKYHDDWGSLTEAEIVALWDEVDLYHLDMYAVLLDLVAEYAVDLEIDSTNQAVAQSDALGSQAGSIVPDTGGKSSPKAKIRKRVISAARP